MPFYFLLPFTGKNFKIFVINFFSCDSVFDFVIFKEISGWEAEEDPMEEQLKRKKGHPLFARRWAPKKKKLTDALSLPDDQITSELFFKISAIAEEGIESK